MNKPQRVLLHLSDIHFGKASKLDPDRMLRQALVDDVARLSEQVDGIDNILVTGDVAFSGQKSQYDVASLWLEELCEASRVDFEQVYVIPGNHDVDRSVIGKSSILPTVRNELRAAEPDKLDAVLKKHLEDKGALDLLLSPIAEYNRFADPFRCAISTEKLWWQDDLLLNDGSVLRVRGLHSALLCDENDTDKEDRWKTILGSAQVDLGHTNGVAHLIMCHHPPTWLRDAENVEQALNAYASIQLFGHRHTFELNTLNDKTLRLASGAVQPDRGERGWQPRYNLLGVSVREDGGQRRLRVEVWPRVWNATEREFDADFQTLRGKDCAEFFLNLKPWRRSAATFRELSPLPSSTLKSAEPQKALLQPLEESPQVAPNLAPIFQATDKTLPDVNVQKQEDAMNAHRKLVFTFLRLPYHTVVKIASDLNLLRDEDQGVGGSELSGRFIQRADEDGRLGDLWDAVAQYAELPNENPFASAGPPLSLTH